MSSVNIILPLNIIDIINDYVNDLKSKELHINKMNKICNMFNNSLFSRKYYPDTENQFTTWIAVDEIQFQAIFCKCCGDYLISSNRQIFINNYELRITNKYCICENLEEELVEEELVDEEFVVEELVVVKNTKIYKSFLYFIILFLISLKFIN